jgi:diacylglycerol diphosphate phosphatase/phosphatidate phosphatase
VLQNAAISSLEPFHRLFSLDDRSIQFPHALIERVPVLQLFLFAAFLPAFVVTAFVLVTTHPRSTSKSHKLHASLLGLAASVALASLITDVIKNGVGRPRPDLIARCKPKHGTPQHELVDWHVCTEMDHHVLHDGFRSFPSGHSSFSWAGLGYLSLFLAGQLKVVRPGIGLTWTIFPLTPILCAMWITITRTEDYRHDVYDATVGSIIGMTCALFAYLRYFPRLGNSTCERPFERGDWDDVEGDDSGSAYERLSDLEAQAMDRGERNLELDILR